MSASRGPAPLSRFRSSRQSFTTPMPYSSVRACPQCSRVALVVASVTRRDPHRADAEKSDLQELRPQNNGPKIPSAGGQSIRAIAAGTRYSAQGCTGSASNRRLTRGFPRSAESPATIMATAPPCIPREGRGLDPECIHQAENPFRLCLEPAIHRTRMVGVPAHQAHPRRRACRTHPALPSSGATRTRNRAARAAG